MDANEFDTKLAALINEAAGKQLPLENIIFCLDDSSFRLKLTLNTIRQQRAMKEMAGRIIPANGQLPPPPRN